MRLFAACSMTTELFRSLSCGFDPSDLQDGLAEVNVRWLSLLAVMPAPAVVSVQGRHPWFPAGCRSRGCPLGGSAGDLMVSVSMVWVSLTFLGWRWSLGLGAVLIEDAPLGRRARSATWGTGREQKFGEEISDGGTLNETFARGL